MGRNICNNKKNSELFFALFKRKSLSCISFSEEKYSKTTKEKGLSLFFIFFKTKNFIKKKINIKIFFKTIQRLAEIGRSWHKKKKTLRGYGSGSFCRKNPRFPLCFGIMSPISPVKSSSFNLEEWFASSLWCSQKKKEWWLRNDFPSITVLDKRSRTLEKAFGYTRAHPANRINGSQKLQRNAGNTKIPTSESIYYWGSCRTWWAMHWKADYQ